MRKGIVYTLILSVLLIRLPMSVCAQTVFTVDGKVNFDESTVNVTVKTPAQYGQHIFVTIYKKGETVTLPTQYIRIGEAFADRSGHAELVFDLSSGVAMGYYIISASGGGYLAGSCHGAAEIYFETVGDLNNITLPAVSAANGNDLNTQLVKLSNYFGLHLGDGYKNDQVTFLKFFQAIRKEDFKDVLNSMAKVQATANGADLLMTTLKAKMQSELETLYEENDEWLNFDSTHEDYTTNKATVYQLFLNLVQKKKNSIAHLGDLRLLLRQSIGMAVINTKNAETVTDSIEKYGESFGIAVQEYTAACSRYGEVSINMNFIGRDFSAPSEVLAAYQSALAAVEKEDGYFPPSSSTSVGRSSPSIKASVLPANDTVAEPVRFSDVPKNHWAYESISVLTEIGAVSGFEDGSFRPDQAVTREQFVKILIEAFGIKSEANCSFSDVPAEHWAKRYIAAAVENKLINGVSEDIFGLGYALSRQDAAVLIARTVDYLGLTMSEDEGIVFADQTDIAEYAAEGVARLSDAGILNGMDDGRFMPNESLTRGQTAKILHAVLSI